ncbi:uncharacterized protein EHS24_004550 [Apiotrichum porosum]|uniref:Uncharacterized protein n=1 Tax=Apiotrichum porosum TaxID=105984 RepID=A0A427Y5E7_9TREE|nr:uncharacterized protein EHS24_004550 [Apiotrichum porosum]RSH86308.1 hypothetical protein EHS24_004550 [Apiotrichum porosum]
MTSRELTTEEHLALGIQRAPTWTESRPLYIWPYPCHMCADGLCVIEPLLTGDTDQLVDIPKRCQRCGRHDQSGCSILTGSRNKQYLCEGGGSFSVVTVPFTSDQRQSRDMRQTGQPSPSPSRNNPSPRIPDSNDLLRRLSLAPTPRAHTMNNDCYRPYRVENDEDEGRRPRRGRRAQQRKAQRDREPSSWFRGHDVYRPDAMSRPQSPAQHQRAAQDHGWPQRHPSGDIRASSNPTIAADHLPALPGREGTASTESNRSERTSTSSSMGTGNRSRDDMASASGQLDTEYPPDANGTHAELQSGASPQPATLPPIQDRQTKGYACDALSADNEGRKRPRVHDEQEGNAWGNPEQSRFSRRIKELEEQLKRKNAAIHSLESENGRLKSDRERVKRLERENANLKDEVIDLQRQILRGSRL